MKIHPPFPRHVDTSYIHLNTSLCKACWACVNVCPQGVLGKVDINFHKHAHIDYAENCIGCLRCVKACPNQAIYTNGVQS